MLQFILSSTIGKSTPQSSSTSSTSSPIATMEEITVELHYCGNILIELESCLLKGDTLMFNSILEDVIPSTSSSPSPRTTAESLSTQLQESKTIEISTVSVNNLTDCGLFFLSLFFSIDCFIFYFYSYSFILC